MSLLLFWNGAGGSPPTPPTPPPPAPPDVFQGGGGFHDRAGRVDDKDVRAFRAKLKRKKLETLYADVSKAADDPAEVAEIAAVVAPYITTWSQEYLSSLPPAAAVDFDAARENEVVRTKLMAIAVEQKAMDREEEEALVAVREFHAELLNKALKWLN